MKVARISDLSAEDLQAYHESALYKLTCSDYRFCDIHLDYYREYFGEKWTDESLVVYDKTGFCISLIGSFKEVGILYDLSPSVVNILDVDIRRDSVFEFLILIFLFFVIIC